MAKSEARRQKQLARKKAKRTDKRAVVARLSSSDPIMRLTDAEHWPIVETLVPEAIWEQGIGSVVLTRRHPSGRFAVSVFLVDVWCLGVKNATFQLLNGLDYNKLLKRIGQNEILRDVSPEYVAKLVTSAVDYAQALGFPPHGDYRQSKMLLEGIDASLCTETFAFGKEGKPFYYRGPLESFAKALSISARVEAAGGETLIRIVPGDEADSTGMQLQDGAEFDAADQIE